MNDLISRQAAIEALEQIRYALNVIKKIDVLRYKIEQLPTAQPEHPEIIRCRDCKYRDDDDDFCIGRGYPNLLVPDDGFCDKGERSE